MWYVRYINTFIHSLSIPQEIISAFSVGLTTLTLGKRQITQRLKKEIRDLKQSTTGTGTRTPPNKRFNEQDNTVHMRYKSLYISLPSSAKQQDEITKFCVFWRTRTAAANFSYFNLEFNAGITHLAWVSSESNRRTEQIYTAAKSQGKI